MSYHFFRFPLRTLGGVWKALDTGGLSRHRVDAVLAALAKNSTVEAVQQAS